MQVFIEKEIILVRKEEKKSGKCRILCRDIVLCVATEFQGEQHKYVAASNFMSQQSPGRNQEEIELCHEKEFFYCDIVEEECEEVYRDTLYSVATLIKENGRGTL